MESNLHIEIDMERIEDRSKALSYIGIEIADALKEIPAPAGNSVEEVVEEAKPVEKVKKAKVQKKEKKAKVATVVEEPKEEKAEVKVAEEVKTVEPIINEVETKETYEPETFEAKPSLWQRIKNSKFVRTIKYIMSIRVVLEIPALPEGKSEN